MWVKGTQAAERKIREMWKKENVIRSERRGKKCSF